MSAFMITGHAPTYSVEIPDVMKRHVRVESKAIGRGFVKLYYEYNRNSCGAGGLKNRPGGVIVWARANGEEGRLSIEGLSLTLASAYVSKKLGIKFKMTRTKIHFEIRSGDARAILESAPPPFTFDIGEEEYVCRVGFGENIGGAL